jgi:hypothetical protein
MSSPIASRSSQEPSSCSAGMRRCTTRRGLRQFVVYIQSKAECAWEYVVASSSKPWAETIAERTSVLSAASAALTSALSTRAREFGGLMLSSLWIGQYWHSWCGRGQYITMVVWIRLGGCSSSSMNALYTSPASIFATSMKLPFAV